MPTTQDRIDTASRHAHNGVDAGRKLAKRAADQFDEAAEDLSSRVSRAVHRTGDVARHGLEWMRDGSDRMRREMSRAGDSTVKYIRHEPVKSVLAAAAAGALVYAVVNALRSRRSDSE